MRQLVSNLMKNAAIHSGGSNVWVSLELVPRGAEVSVELMVADDGKGIPSDHIERVFSAFGRGDTTKNGSGLGLYIAQQLARQLGGDLRYQDSRYGGAEFRVQFTAEYASDESEVEPQTQAVLEGLNVLLAEDDRVLRLLTEKILSKHGAKVKSCEDGQIALDSFTQGSFDLVLTDAVMPEMNGTDLIKGIRVLDVQIPIIAVTAAVVGEDTDELLEAGANAVISKPLSYANLAATLSKVKSESAKR